MISALYCGGMQSVLITGSAGLIGSEAVRFYAEQGNRVVGIDNDMRRYFFGEQASTAWKRDALEKEYEQYHHCNIDIRNYEELQALMQHESFSLIIHTAAQPSHDWAAREPLTDFGVNAVGTLNLLELTRQYQPDAVFIFTSTNKVYGDLPNFLPLEERETRWEIADSHPYAQGIDETMSIDQSTHSVFGASKVAADVMVQEYGKYFGVKTGTFRGGCLSGPAHSGAQLHGFLAYLVRCIANEEPYTVFGYKGKQVRDNIHSADVIRAFDAFAKNPRPGEVYNIGGTRHSNISMLEAIDIIGRLLGKKPQIRIVDDSRKGDHIWYVSSMEKFKRHYPDWSHTYDCTAIIEEIIRSGHIH